MKYNEALKSSECKNSYKKQKYFFYYYIIYNYNITMSISSTGIYGSTALLNSDLFTDLFQDVNDIKQDIEDVSVNKIPAIIQDISLNLSKINDISTNKIPNLILIRVWVCVCMCVCMCVCLHTHTYTPHKICIYVFI